MPTFSPPYAAKAAKAAAKGTGKGKPPGGKGPGGGGGERVPPGCREKTDDGRQICYAFNKGRCNRVDSCKFAHVSWQIPAAGAGVGQG